MRCINKYRLWILLCTQIHEYILKQASLPGFFGLAALFDVFWLAMDQKFITERVRVDLVCTFTDVSFIMTRIWIRKYGQLTQIQDTQRQEKHPNTKQKHQKLKIKVYLKKSEVQIRCKLSAADWQREEIKSKTRHVRVELQNKTGNDRQKPKKIDFHHVFRNKMVFKSSDGFYFNKPLRQE